MYERVSNPDCPVKSFEKYLSKLNPRNNCMSQRPQDSFDPEIQFGMETRHWVKIL